MIWKNQYTDYITVEALADEVKQIESAKNRNRVSGMGSFTFASLDLSLDDTLNALHTDINWNLLDRSKLKRSIMYKERMFNNANIPTVEFNEPGVDTFSQWLVKNFQNETR